MDYATLLKILLWSVYPYYYHTCLYKLMLPCPSIPAGAQWEQEDHSQFTLIYLFAQIDVTVSLNSSCRIKVGTGGFLGN